MSRRNEYEARCDVCGTAIPALEGIVEALDTGSGYCILCAEHAPDGSLDPPKSPDVTKLPSIHIDEARFER